MLNLYRIMTDVRAGSHQRSVAVGQPGLVTVWVHAESEPLAIARATAALTNKRYGSIGSLTCYTEVLDNDPLGCSTEDDRAAERRGDSILAGYEAMKDRALVQADGLHEVWFDVADRATVRNRKMA